MRSNALTPWPPRRLDHAVVRDTHVLHAPPDYPSLTLTVIGQGELGVRSVLLQPQRPCGDRETERSGIS
jgi:hypothetical protein